MQIKRLGFARECSNRSGDDFFLPFLSRVRELVASPARETSHLSLNRDYQ
jgi:hypothetical protein